MLPVDGVATVGAERRAERTKEQVEGRSGLPAANPFLPRLFRVNWQRDDSHDVRTWKLLPMDGQPLPTWRAGQFGHFTVFGVGEAVFTLANSPTRNDSIECTFRAIGKVTEALRALAVGQVIGFRGPFGNWFPTDEWKGRDLAFIGGGIGMAALRAPLQWVLDHREDYGDIVILNGARSVRDVLYNDEMPEWAALRDVKVVRTVDPGGETPDWDGEVGLLPAVYEKLGLGADGRIVITCGPPVMLHFLFLALEKMGYQPEQVVTTLENKMKCGLGLCGRCNVGRHFVCVDGPVFTWAQMNGLPKDF